MSIYSIMAFNAATDKAKQNIKDSQDIDAKRVQTQTAQQELDLNKQLNQAKVKQARNEGLMSDYIGKQLEDHLNDTYKAKNDQLDAIQGLQDIQQHKAQTQAQQAAQFATQLHAQDPDVQAHVSTLTGIMGTQGQQAPADVNSAQGGESPQAQMSMAPQAAQPQAAPLPSIPGIAPVQGGASPQNVGAQVAPPAGAPQPDPATALMGAPEPAAEPAEPSALAQAPQQEPQQGGGVDLSPLEQAYGMPKGSMWLDPATMKPGINPIWKSKVEKQQAAEANYGADSPARQFKEEVRQDRNIKTAETYLVNSLKSRGGAIGLQNNKVEAAIHARALINQLYDPQTGSYNISQVPYGELSESLGALLSGQTGSSEGRIAALKQKTAQGDINGALTYITGKPSNATSQEAIKQLVDIIDRQGEVSEQLRDKAFDNLKRLPTFGRLDEASMQQLKEEHLGNSFKDYIKDAPDKQPGAKQATNKYKAGESRNVNGVNYTRGADGKWYSQ